MPRGARAQSDRHGPPGRSVLIFAPLRLPGAGADAAHALALPNSTAPVAGQLADAVRPLAAGLHDDPHGPLWGHLALQADRGDALISDISSHARHAITVGGVAGPARGDDEDAPRAVIKGARGRRAGCVSDAAQGKNRGKKGGQNGAKGNISRAMAALWVAGL